MSLTRTKDGRYRIGLVPFGEHLQGRGWNIAEHSAFGDGHVGKHSPNSYHYSDRALDITWKNNKYGDFDPTGKIGWQKWTDNLGHRLKGSATEVLHQSNDPNHSTHVHLAADDGFLYFTPDQAKDFGLVTDDGAPSVVHNPDEDGSFTPQGVAKERAQEFITRKRTAGDVVDGFGNGFDQMKSSALAENLRSAQESIIQKRMDAGERFGSITVPKPQQTNG